MMNAVRKRERTLALALLAVALVLAGPAAFAGPETQGVRLVQGSSGMVWMPIHVARQLQYFRREGLEVEYIVTGGGAKAAQILVAGAADFAATTITDMINARRRGADVRVLAPLLLGYPTDCVLRTDVAKRLGVASSAPIKNRIEALRGLKVGLGGQGSPADQLIIWSAKLGGFDPTRDVQRIFLGTSEAVLSALKNHAIDAFCYGPPTSTAAVDSGEAIFLFHIVGGKDFLELQRFPAAVLATTDRYIRQHADVVGRLARAYVRAVEFMKNNPDKVPDAIKPLYLNMDAKTFEGAFESARSGFPGSPLLETKVVQDVIKFMEDTTGEHIAVRAQDLVDASWVKKAMGAQ